MGIIFWIGLAYESVDLLTAYFPHLNIWLIWIVFVLANLPGVYLFLNGFYLYMVWTAALNLVVRELAELGACSDISGYSLRVTNRSVDFSLILTFLFAIVFVPLGISFMPIAFGATHPHWYVVSMIISVLMIGFGLILSGIAMIFLSLVFQVFAFTPGSAGASIFRSIDLVKHHILKTLAVILVAFIAIQFVIPTLLTALLDWTHITAFITSGVELGVRYVLSKCDIHGTNFQTLHPVMTNIYTMITHDPHGLSAQITESMIYTYISALLLPLGTCWFALLYGDLKTVQELKEKPPTVIEAVPLS